MAWVSEPSLIVLFPVAPIAQWLEILLRVVSAVASVDSVMDICCLHMPSWQTTFAERVAGEEPCAVLRPRCCIRSV